MTKKTTIPEAALTYLKQIGSKGGKVGGRARAKKLTPAQRTRIARKAARARWGKKEGS